MNSALVISRRLQSRTFATLTQNTSFKSCLVHRRSFNTVPSLPNTAQSLLYTAPLSKVVRNLKIFSISSLGLSLCLSPAILLIDSNLPLMAKYALVGIALSTSALSTALIHYFIGPYAIRATLTGPSADQCVDITHLSIFAREHHVLVPVDSLERIDGEGLRFFANVRSGQLGKLGKRVWYFHDQLNEPSIAQFWKVVDKA